ncbi:hypothetical protein [Spongiactinospora sp. 9N601]|uniref:hypothetical protein n=1 Tax=Spongiactinospora sp. 9N601 TaxID=3375149 RepID=UPI0037AF6138
MILAIIIACEIGFWALLGLGLAARYLWRMRRLSNALLLSLPLLDVILLVAAVIDMRSGAVGSIQHGLAAAYIAYSIMFGHRTIKWADAKFAHRFAGGPPPRKPPTEKRARARYEWGVWLRILAAYAITCAVLLGVVWMVDDHSRTSALMEFMANLAKVPLIALIWPVSYSYQASRKPVDSPSEETTAESPRQ